MQVNVLFYWTLRVSRHRARSGSGSGCVQRTAGSLSGWPADIQVPTKAAAPRSAQTAGGTRCALCV